MPLAGPAVDVGNKLAVFIDVETTLGTRVSDLPLAADAVRVSGGSANVKQPTFMTEAKICSTGQLFGGNDKETASCTLQGFLDPAGSGTAPDISSMLTSGGWTETIAGDDTVEGSSTTTLINATGHTYTVGEWVEIDGDLVEIISTNTNDFTVSPALSSTPATPAITGSTAYTYKSTRWDSQDSATIWIFNQRSVDVLLGAVMTKLSFGLGGTGGGTWTAEFTARRGVFLGSSLLDGAINDSVTTIVVDDGSIVPSTTSATEVWYLQIDSEVVEVVAVSGNTLTVSTRGVFGTGGAAASHSDNAIIYPYQPTGTYAGNHVANTSGRAVINTLVAANESTTIDMEMGVEARAPEHGDPFMFNGYVPVANGHDVTWGTSLRSEADAALAVRMEAIERSEIPAYIQQGGTAGTIFAARAPQTRFENPEVDRSADEVRMDMTGKGMLSAAAQNDVISFAFG